MSRNISHSVDELTALEMLGTTVGRSGAILRNLGRLIHLISAWTSSDDPLIHNCILAHTLPQDPPFLVFFTWAKDR